MNDSITIGVVKKQDNGSKVISLSSYQQLYDLVINSKLVPNAWYRFPYRSVNFLHGWRNSNDQTFADLDGYQPRDVYTSDEEILLVQAISSFQISKTAYSEKYPQDIIQYQPFTNKLGVNVSIFNNVILPNELEVSNFDLQFDGTNVFFQMPAGYPALFGHYFYLYAEFQKIIQNPPTGGEILTITYPMVTLPFSHTTETIGAFTGTVNIEKQNQGSFAFPEEVIISTNGNGKDARCIVNPYGSSPVYLQLIPVVISEISCFGNGYAEGDELYFTYDGENYTHTITNTEIKNDRGSFNISNSLTNGNGVGAEFLAYVFLSNGIGRPSEIKLILQNGGQLYSVEDEITIQGSSIGLTDVVNDAMVTITDANNIETTSTTENYYQDGCFEPLTPNICTCQFPYTSDEPSFNYGKAMSRIRVDENGMKIILLDLTEEDYNNYMSSTLYVETIEAIADAYGWIVKRTDKERNISLPLDFRNRKYRRWKITYNNSNLGIDSNYYYCVNNISEPGILFDFKDLKVIDNEIVASIESMNVSSLEGIIGGPDANWYLGYFDNFVFLGRTSNTYLGTKLINSTFGDAFNLNKIYEECFDFLAGNNVYHNEIKSISQSIIGNFSYNNKLREVTNCITGYQFTENVFYCSLGYKNFTIDDTSKTLFQKAYQLNSNFQIVRQYINESNNLELENI